MKTLADLKRNLKIGVAMTMTKAEGQNRLIGIKRYIVATQGNGIYLNADKEAKGGSFLDFPKASLLEYDGETLKIFDAGYRDLTPEEQAILDNKPSKRAENQKQAEIDMMTDGSTTFYMDKAYFDEKDANWYWRETKGLYYVRNGKMRDASIKGTLCLAYKIEKE